MGHTKDTFVFEVGTMDQQLGRGSYFAFAEVDTSSDDNTATPIKLPDNVRIVRVVAEVGATAFSQATTLSVGTSADDDAYVNAFALGTNANTVFDATATEANVRGKAGNLANVGANAVIHTKLSRAQANADLKVGVEYVHPFPNPLPPSVINND